jgi:transketolase
MSEATAAVDADPGGPRLTQLLPIDAIRLGETAADWRAAVRHDQLSADGIAARVIDLYSIKPIDAATIAAAARETGRLVTVEDHRPEGGLGEAVIAALADDGVSAGVCRLAVANMPGSASPEEQLADAGIDATAIVAAARELLRS